MTKRETLGKTDGRRTESTLGGHMLSILMRCPLPNAARAEPLPYN